MIPIENLIKNEIAAEDYVILKLLYQRKFDLLYKYTNRSFDFYKVVIQILLNRGFVKNNEGLEITSDGINILKNIENTMEFHEKLNQKEAIPVGRSLNELVSEFREIFPAGSINGYPSRGDKQGCIKKMKKFRKNYPEFDDELILHATKKYIGEKKRDNYEFLMQAHYFIEKNNVSLLASICEDILENGSKVNTSKNVLDL